MKTYYSKDLIVVIEYLLLNIENNVNNEMDIDKVFEPIFNKYGTKITSEEYLVGVIYTFLDILIDAKNHSNKYLSDSKSYFYEEGISDLKKMIILLKQDLIKEENEIIETWSKL